MSAEELERKRKLRGAHRAAITRTIKQVQELSARPEIDRARLRQKRIALEEKRGIIKRIDSEILEAVPGEELVTEIERADEVQEHLELAIIAIDEALSKHTSRPSSPSGTAGALEDSTSPSATTTTSATTTASTTGAASTTLTTGGTTTSAPVVTTSAGVTVTTPTGTTPVVSTPIITTTGRIKLPEITIKKFNGELTKWSTFWDTFEATIHNNPALAPVQKFTYLQSLLESSAAETVSGLALTAANYEEAIGTLKKRYGNKQLIVSKHMEVLMNLEIVGSENDTHKLRRLLDTVETQVRALKALGVSAESYGGLLASILLNKLPPEVRLIVSSGLTSDNWELDKLVELFEAELDARERAMASRPKKTSQGRNPPTSQTLNTPTSPSCVYCGQNLSSANCLTVSTVEARKQSLRRSGRCYICLKRIMLATTAGHPPGVLSVGTDIMSVFVSSRAVGKQPQLA